MDAQLLHQVRTQDKVVFRHYLGLTECQALAEALQGNRVLKTLSLNGINFDGDGGHRCFEAIVAGLKGSSVSRLAVLHCPLRDQGVRCLSALLPGSSLTSLTLYGMTVGTKGVRALATILKHTDLRELVLYNTGIEAEAAQSLADGLAGCSLTALDLQNNSLGDDGVRAIAIVLKDTALLELKLSGNRMGPVGAQALAQGLKGSSLVTLEVAFNRFGVEGLRALVAALKDAALKELDLSYNSIGDGGAQALAMALKSSQVTRPRLSQKIVRHEGATASGAGSKDTAVQAGGLDQMALVLSESITSLNLQNCGIGTKGAEALLEGLSGSAVRWLNLSTEQLMPFKNNASQEILDQIKAVVHANKTRTFVLQMVVQRTGNQLNLSFRTLSGSVAASLTCSVDLPVQDLPEAVLISMQSSGFQLKGCISCDNLRLVRPDGAVMDVGPTAPPLAQQLGLSLEPAEAPGVLGS